MKLPYTGAILAGGLNTRYAGKNKAFITVDGERIIDRTRSLFDELFSESILVTNAPLDFLDLNAMTVTDLFSARSSLTGIHAGLFYSTTPFTFFAACDAPFIKKELVELLLSQIDRSIDIVIPQTSAGLEPLCAVYSKKCLHPIEKQLAQRDFTIKSFFNQIKLKKVTEDQLRQVDPDLISFYNINTPDDLNSAYEMIRIKQESKELK